MSDAGQGQSTANRGEPPWPPSPKPRGAGSWGPLRILAVVLVIVFGLFGLAGIAIWVSVNETLNRRPAAVPAPISWTTHGVVVSREQPMVHGRLTLEAARGPQPDIRIGVNAGLPELNSTASPGVSPANPGANADPAIVLSGPAILLSAGSGNSCFAPCNLRVNQGLNCYTGTCRLDLDVTVALVGPSAPVDTTVMIEVSAAVTVSLDQRLPESMRFDFVLDGVGPGAS